MKAKIAADTYDFQSYVNSLPLVYQQRLYLLEELERHGKQYRDFGLLKETIRRESNWNSGAKHLNENKTIDSGLGQINSCWENKAKELGLDFKNNWKDNLNMVIYIYKNHGLYPWVAMRKSL